MTVNGRKANVGRILHNKPLNKACAVDYYYHGVAYTVSYQLPYEADDPNEVCNAAIALAERD